MRSPCANWPETPWTWGMPSWFGKIAKIVYREWDRLKLRNNLWQLFLPSQFKREVLRSLHNEHGHLGPGRAFLLMRDRFYWPRMKSEVEEYCQTCMNCIQRKTLPKWVALMGHLQSQGPIELVCIDFWCLDPDSSGKRNVLVVTDHFTRYAQAFPIQN